MRVLVLGANGMLGHKLYQVLGAALDVWGTVRGNASDLERYDFYRIDRIIGGVDAREIETVRRALEIAAPDVVINAIGAVKQLPSGNDPVDALTINAIFPHKLADLTEGSRTRLITISTDCVFSGRKGNYSETDAPDATDLYGISKRFGELERPNSITLRTSIIGRELASQHGFVEWFLAERCGSVRGYVKAIFSGLTTISLVRVIRDLIEDHAQLSGLYHVSADPISKFDLVVALNEAFATAMDVKASNEVEIDRSLDSSLFRSATGWRPPSWQEMIAELAADPTPYDRWRKAKVE